MTNFVSSLIALLVLAHVSVADAQGAAGEGTTSAPAAPPSYAQEPQAAAGTIRDISVHDRPMTLSALAYVPWIYGIGIGLFTGFEIPVVKDGFIPRLNDQFSIEPSFAFAYSTYRRSAFDDDFALLYRVGCSALWSFYFSEKLRVFANLTFAYTRVDVNSDARFFRGFGRNHFWPDFSVGVFYQFASRVAVRGELGAQGLRGGIAFLL